jgi:hypothetical protein
MSPVPFIEVEETEFQLGRFLRTNWFLLMIISIFAALSAFLTVIFPEPGNAAAAVEIFGIQFNLQEICVSTSLLITYLGSFAVLWASFAEPKDKPIFYYFIGVESFKRLLLVISLFVLVTSLSLWVAIKFPDVFTVIFSVIAFCLGIVVFSTLLVYISRATRIRKIAYTTIGYSLGIFIVSLFLLISIDLQAIVAYYVPILFFIYAMGTAAVFYVIVTLIFEVIIPVVKGGQ